MSQGPLQDRHRTCQSDQSSQHRHRRSMTGAPRLSVFVDNYTRILCRRRPSFLCNELLYASVSLWYQVSIQTTRVPVLSIVWRCLRDPTFSHSVEHRDVTDGWTDRQTDTRREFIALASIARVKMRLRLSIHHALYHSALSHFSLVTNPSHVRHVFLPHDCFTLR